jgi:hypothetical protein
MALTHSNVTRRAACGPFARAAVGQQRSAATENVPRIQLPYVTAPTPPAAQEAVVSSVAMSAAAARTLGKRPRPTAGRSADALDDDFYAASPLSGGGSSDDDNDGSGSGSDGEEAGASAVGPAASSAFTSASMDGNLKRQRLNDGSGVAKTGAPKALPAAASAVVTVAAASKRAKASISGVSGKTKAAEAAAPARGAAALAGKKGSATAAASTASGSKPDLYAKQKTVLLCRQPAAVQADAFWAAFKACPVGKDLSLLELGGRVTAEHIATSDALEPPTTAAATAATSDKPAKPAVPTSTAAAGTAPPVLAVAGSALDDELADLRRVVRGVLPNWKKVFGWKNGAAARPRASPELILVASSARRAADLLKPLAVFNTRAAKLFAKHLSVEEQATILAGPPVTLAVGTPHRIARLLADGHLKLDRCAVLLFDTRPDMKGYSILNHPNLVGDAFGMYLAHFHARVVAGDTKIALF